MGMFKYMKAKQPNSPHLMNFHLIVPIVVIKSNLNIPNAI